MLNLLNAPLRSIMKLLSVYLHVKRPTEDHLKVLVIA